MALTTYYFPDFVSSLPSVIEALFKEVAGAFPIRGTGLIQNANLTGGYSFVCGIFSLYLFFITDNKKSKPKFPQPSLLLSRKLSTAARRERAAPTRKRRHLFLYFLASFFRFPSAFSFFTLLIPLRHPFLKPVRRN